MATLLVLPNRRVWCTYDLKHSVEQENIVTQREREEHMEKLNQYLRKSNDKEACAKAEIRDADRRRRRFTDGKLPTWLKKQDV